jgi:hypothetical protein
MVLYLAGRVVFRGRSLLDGLFYKLVFQVFSDLELLWGVGVLHESLLMVHFLTWILVLRLPRFGRIGVYLARFNPDTSWGVLALIEQLKAAVVMSFLRLQDLLASALWAHGMICLGFPVLDPCCIVRRWNFKVLSLILELKHTIMSKLSLHLLSYGAITTHFFLSPELSRS